MIVVADDFGFSDEINAAIIEAFERGLITHASIIANTPAFAEACKLARERGLLGRLGTHLNLTEGIPLTDPMKACRRFCDDQGRFRYWRKDDHAFRISRDEHNAVTAELRAQILRCRMSGIQPTHLDSHNHVHNKRAIGKIAVSLALELDVPRVRLAHNCGAHASFANRLYKAWFVNRGLQRAGLAGTRWYGGTDDFLHLKQSGAPTESLESFELNTHPAYRNGVLVDWIVQPHRPLEDLLAEIVPSAAQ